jgi:hypothetical protein
MTDNWKPPALELGEVEATSADGTDGICYDNAVIFFDCGPEQCSIDIECPAALRLAAFIVKAVNNHDALVKHLHHLATVCCDEDALRLLDSLNDPVGQTGSRS